MRVNRASSGRAATARVEGMHRRVSVLGDLQARLALLGHTVRAGARTISMRHARHLASRTSTSWMREYPQKSLFYACLSQPSADPMHTYFHITLLEPKFIFSRHFKHQFLL